MNHNPAPVKEPLKLDPSVSSAGNEHISASRQGPNGVFLAQAPIFSEFLLFRYLNLVAQGGAAKIKCNQYLILKDRENHIFLDPLLCQARDSSRKALELIYLFPAQLYKWIKF
uniref:Uncharacterized protein n=1 Tax=Candidatus Kentrum sp. LPFa TaxID=2126335 RepID=A0A450WTM0_9GAMM|nr:MAG: hypothetical protein BECKLPF1236B_GA0070989_12083 [Candidatus Kentron sp. LPFa]